MNAQICFLKLFVRLETQYAIITFCICGHCSLTHQTLWNAATCTCIHNTETWKMSNDYLYTFLCQASAQILLFSSYKCATQWSQFNNLSVIGKPPGEYIYEFGGWCKPIFYYWDRWKSPIIKEFLVISGLRTYNVTCSLAPVSCHHEQRWRTLSSGSVSIECEHCYDTLDVTNRRMTWCNYKYSVGKTY